MRPEAAATAPRQIDALTGFGGRRYAGAMTRPGTTARAPQSSALPAAWQLGRIGMGFYIDLMEAAREGGDLLSPLLLAAVIEANVAPINQDPERQVRYAGLEAPPLDELRRPVSMHAIAESLSLPYETVRRRFRQLEAEGRCVIRPDGVVVPTSVLSTPLYRAQAQARYERLKQFYADLAAHTHVERLLALAPGAETAAPAALPEPPVRLCNRLISEYALRQTEILLRRIRDPYAVFILLNIARANVRHVPLRPGGKDLPAQPDAQRAIRPAELAERLELSGETVRRRLARLEELGYLQRRSDGLILSQDAMQGELMHELIEAALRNTLRLFTRLRVLGVLDHWRDVEGLPGARSPSA